MQKFIRIAAVVALIGLGYWGWQLLSSGPEKVIRSRLAELARTVSFEPQEGTVPRAFKAQQIPDFFTTDTVITLEPRGYSPQSFSGRDEVLDAALTYTRVLRGLQVEFLDTKVTLDPDGQTALAHLTGQATVSGEKDFQVMELNFRFRKVDGKWLIYRVETVKTLLRFWNIGPRPIALEAPTSRRPGRRPVLPAIG